MKILYKHFRKLKNVKFKNLLFFVFLFLLLYQTLVFGKISFSTVLTTPTTPLAALQDRGDVKNIQETLVDRTKNLKIPSEVEFRMKLIENKIKTLTKNSDKWKLEKVLNEIPAFINTSKQIQIFYSTAYRSLECDGYWSQWKQDLFEDDINNDDKNPSELTLIGSNFYPLLGCYSSNDPHIIDIHLKQIQNAGVGVVIISWSPTESTNTKENFIDVLLNKASKFNILIALKIEDYKGRNIESVFRYIKLLRQYTKHPSYYKHSKHGANLPVFYVHESHLIPAMEWRKLLSGQGSQSVRSTEYDGLFFGLILDSTHRYHIERSNFDGFYTYHASNGAFYGSSWKNWETLGKFAKEHKLLFLPTVSPGYVDTRVRPWNNALMRHRSRGHYYQAAWRAAIAADTFGVTVASFNHWLDGSQIEPAVPRLTPQFNYLDYQPEGPLFYLNLTKYWVNMFLHKSNL